MSQLLEPLQEPLNLREVGRLVEEKKPACICGADLRGIHVEHYGPHEGGYLVGGYMERQWVYIHCFRCGYDMALHKIWRELI